LSLCLTKAKAIIDIKEDDSSFKAAQASKEIYLVHGYMSAFATTQIVIPVHLFFYILCDKIGPNDTSSTIGVMQTTTET
jgi:hypothetical protein